MPDSAPCLNSDAGHFHPALVQIEPAQHQAVNHNDGGEDLAPLIDHFQLVSDLDLMRHGAHIHYMQSFVFLARHHLAPGDHHDYAGGEDGPHSQKRNEIDMHDSPQRESVVTAFFGFGRT